MSENIFSHGLAILVGIMLAMLFLRLNVPTWALVLIIGKPYFRPGMILRLKPRNERILVHNRRVRPPLDGERMMWVYDGVVLGVTRDGEVEFRTGISCVPERDLEKIGGLS